jgi:hypothetical protein
MKGAIKNSVEDVLQFPANRSNLDIEDLNNGAMV